jgi:hypothetical protein
MQGPDKEEKKQKLIEEGKTLTDEESMKIPG